MVSRYCAVNDDTGEVVGHSNTMEGVLEEAEDAMNEYGEDAILICEVLGEARREKVSLTPFAKILEEKGIFTRDV